MSHPENAAIQRPVLRALSDLKLALLAAGLDAPVAITLGNGQLASFESVVRREAVGTFVFDPTLRDKATSVYGIAIQEVAS